MFRVILLLISASSIVIAADKTPVDLIREGRIKEARRIIEQTHAPERYSLILDAISEPNAIEACFLYREISSRFPGTDCDEFAQDRLLQAAEFGIDISTLVLEQPDMTQADFNATPQHYEVERPLTVSTTVPDAFKSPFAAIPEVSSASAPEVSREDTPVLASGKPAVRTPIATTAAPVVEPVEITSEEVKEEVPAPMEENKSEIPAPIEENKGEVPAPSDVGKPGEVTSGVTLDYGTSPKNDSTVKQAAMTPDQSMVRKDDVAEAKEPQRTATSARGVEPVAEEVEKPHDIEPDNGEWYIQVGAFGSLANADKIAAKLRSAGYRVVLVPFDEGDRHLMQVRVGGYSSKVEGRRIGDEIHSKFNVPAVLVTQ